MITTKGFGLIGIIITLAVVILAGGGSLYWKELQNQKTFLQNGNDAVKKAEDLKAKIEQQNKPVVNESALDTSNWKTYRNEKYGFEFKYPPYLIINDGAQINSFALISLHNQQVSEKTEFMVEVALYGASFDRWFSPDFEKEGQVSIGGQTAEKLYRAGIAGKENVDTAIYIISSKHIAIIFEDSTKFFKASQFELSQVDFEVLLPTFKFFK